MGLSGTLLMYSLIGLAVAIATVLQDSAASSRRALSFTGALLFWPLFAPLLFRGPRTVPIARQTSGTRRELDQQLARALLKLQGVSSGLLAPEIERVRGLSSQLTGMIRRLEEMDRLLSSPEFDRKEAEQRLAELTSRAQKDDPRIESLEARLRNIDRLHAMRARTHAELERALLMIEDLAARAVLLELAGRPDMEVVQHIKDIADGVQRIAEGLWPAT